MAYINLCQGWLLHVLQYTQVGFLSYFVLRPNKDMVG